MHYQLFIPGKHTPIQSAFEKAGLDLGFHPNSMSVELRGENSPAGVSGTLFFWKKNDTEPCGYRPDEQTWVPSLDEGKYWIGFWNDSPPTPEELQRPVTYSGKNITLADNQEWLIPAARYCPHKFEFGSHGEATEEIRDEYREFWEKSGEYLERFLNPDNSLLSDISTKWASHAYFAMKINYRVVPEFVNHYSLIDNKNVVGCVAATCCEHELMTEIGSQKKSDSPPDTQPA